jgi:hypothetical protein
MIGLTLLATSIGLLLGFFRYKVTVMLPALFVLLIAVAVFAVVAGLGGWETSVAGILATVGLQLGYAVAVLRSAVRHPGTVAVQNKPSVFGISRFN